MSFEIIGNDQPVLDMPPELAGLMGLAVAPVIVAGVATTAGTFAAWLAKDGWSTGDYNHYMRTMDGVLRRWDKLGWQKGSDGKACWRKNPAARAEWKNLMIRFGKHYVAHPLVSSMSFLSDAEEGPARTLMAELQPWGTFFDKTCKLSAGIAPGLDPESGVAPPGPGGGPADFLKYGAWLIGGIVALNVITGLRGAFPQKPTKTG